MRRNGCELNYRKRGNLPTCWHRFGEKKEGITHTISRSLGPRHPVTSKENQQVGKLLRAVREKLRILADVKVDA
jgi:hypothetical protein